MGAVVYGVPVGRARPSCGFVPTVPVLSVNGVTPDGRGRVRIPTIVHGAGDPPATGMVEGDQYLDTGSLQLWHAVTEPGRGIVWKRQDMPKSLDGRTFDLSTADGMAAAIAAAVEKLGGTAV